MNQYMLMHIAPLFIIWKLPEITNREKKYILFMFCHWKEGQKNCFHLQCVGIEGRPFSLIAHRTISFHTHKQTGLLSYIFFLFRHNYPFCLLPLPSSPSWLAFMLCKKKSSRLCSGISLSLPLFSAQPIIQHFIWVSGWARQANVHYNDDMNEFLYVKTRICCRTK